MSEPNLKEIDDYIIDDLIDYIGTLPVECNIYESIHEDNFSRCTCAYESIKQLVEELKDVRSMSYD